MSSLSFAQLSSKIEDRYPSKGARIVAKLRSAQLKDRYPSKGARIVATSTIHAPRMNAEIKLN